MKQIDFTLYEKDGEIIFRNKKQLIADLKASGWKEMEGVIRKKTKNRSILQNRYYRGCVRIVANDLGYYPERMHQIISFKFLKALEVDEKTGEVSEYVKSTKDLTTTEFALFMNEFMDWAQEFHNIALPKAGEQLTLST